MAADGLAKQVARASVPMALTNNPPYISVPYFFNEKANLKFDRDNQADYRLKSNTHLIVFILIHIKCVKAEEAILQCLKKIKTGLQYTTLVSKTSETTLIYYRYFLLRSK